VIVHAGNGVFVGDHGYELVLALTAGLVVVAALAAGRFSVDGLIGRSSDEPVDLRRTESASV
jgi:putative oxidoreductase